ncbi:MAG: alanine racemase [Candidatus Rokubacteria bacterium]|nr:alanine racemase [Candidatus Rokubacteria bacterium]
MGLTRHTFGAISKYSGAALNTRAPLVPTSVVDSLDGCDVRALARQFGSPLFVVAEARLREEFRAFRAAFRQVYPHTEVAYSYKTNYLTGIRAILHEEGAWAEVVSGLEHDMAEQLGVPGERTIFNGPYKTDEDLRRAVKAGAWINVDNFDELTALERVAGEMGRTPAIGLRLAVAVTETPWEKFGFSLEAGLAEEAARRVAESASLRLAGLHIHLGTDLPRPEVFRDLLALVIPLMAKLEQRHGVRWEMLDLGGGFPNRHRYARGRPGTSPDDVFPAFAGAIAKPLASALRRLASPPKLVLEPGRAVVEHPVFLLTTVAAVKRLPGGAKAAVLDAGVHLLPTAYYSLLDIAPTETTPLSVEDVTLFGPLCMQVDCLGSGLRLPPLRRGVLLVVKNCGAYTDSQSLQFIQPRPAVVLVSAGRADLLREAESLEHFVGRDRLPPRLGPLSTRPRRRP